MQTKTLEIRDRGTFIAALAIRFVFQEHEAKFRETLANEGEAAAKPHAAVCRLWHRTGYGPGVGSYVIMMKLADCRAANDPYEWGNRTMTVAHDYVRGHWDELTDGDVVDVEFILGESETKKRPE